MLPHKRLLEIDDLDASHYMVSVHKYGFFLCMAGTARVLLGTETYQIMRNHLCIYPPNTLCQILERSDDLEGVFEVLEVDECHRVVNTVDIRKRIQIRDAPCVEISAAQAASIIRLCSITREEDANPNKYNEPPAANMNGGVVKTVRDESIRYLRYAICLKVLEAYFGNSPVEAMPHSKDDAILNRFLVSVHENCHRQRTVRYYADEQHLSPYYFSSIIRARSGKSALQWIGDISIIFAKQYLKCTETSIKEIADRMNFPDQSSFGRYFKHHEGCSPSEFRARKSRE